MTSQYCEMWTLLIYRAVNKERLRNDPQREGYWPVGPALVPGSGDSVANRNCTC